MDAAPMVFVDVLAGLAAPANGIEAHGGIFTASCSSCVQVDQKTARQQAWKTRLASVGSATIATNC
jgi:NAD-dependent SIR2 family protein deacetylase